MDENKTYGTRSARLWKLFLSTLYISSFTFGGGHSGWGIRPRRQGAGDPLMGVYCPEGRSVCRKYGV